MTFQDIRRSQEHEHGRQPREICYTVNADLAAVRTSPGRSAAPALIDEALTDLLEKRRSGRPRSHVMDAYQRSQSDMASSTRLAQ
jgi:hypothetical protein